MVPERAGKVATNGDQAGEQDGGQMFARCISGDGYVPRAYGVDTVTAGAQSALQRDGRPAQSKLNGLCIASSLRFISAHTTPGKLLILQLALCLTLTTLTGCAGDESIPCLES